MKTRLRPYSEYRDSGVPWLGEVPQHWAVERLKARVANIVEQTDRRGDGELYVALEHVESWTGRLREVRTAVTFDSQVKRFSGNDVLFGKLRPYLAKVTRPKGCGVCVGEFFVLRPRTAEVSPSYLEYLLRSKPFIDAVNSSTFGARMPRADWQFMGNMAVVIPPLAEQSAVVSFLNAVDRRINRLIRAKRRMIELLNEQKQAIIHRAVTRGLDPNVRLKPSGIDWLGDVPEHWDVVPFVRCVVDRADYRGATPEKVDSGVFLVTAKNVRKGWIDYEASKEYVRVDQYDHIMRRGLPRLGDILFTTEAPLGHVALMDRDDVALAQRIIRFRTDERRLNNRFALYSLLSDYFQNQLQMRATGSTAEGIKASKLPQLLILRPPIQEQLEIVRHIDVEVQQLESVMERVHREIALIREYRTRLIADVVTGKLDVRGVELPALEELGELDDLGADADAVDDDLSETELPEDDE